MIPEKVTAIFDIGKTNKKVLLFDSKLKVIYQLEKKFPAIIDEDGVECDDIELIESWIQNSLDDLLSTKNYEISAVNFSTYGASLVYLDKTGKRLSPVYNYLKEVPHTIREQLYDRYGGETEFCRKTASPSLGFLLNSGIQIMWLKTFRPEVFREVKSILHFPQYLSYLLTGKITSEATSIGCHTFLWDFDRMQYHSWVADEQLKLPDPVSNDHTCRAKISNKQIDVGPGIHDSSASLAPYILGSSEKFILVSTGTWCINMNPFNQAPLTARELQSDCLSYLSMEQKAVKSSRLFMGHIHDVNVQRIAAFYGAGEDDYKALACNEQLAASYYTHPARGEIFFKNGVPKDYIDKSADLSEFSDFSGAYHRFMFDLTMLNKQSIDLILGISDEVENIYVSGGFARNEFFVRMLATFYPGKMLFTSAIDNASALGAALVMQVASPGKKSVKIDLGLKLWDSLQY